MHGVIKDGWLIKRGNQVVKFWKYKGYAIPAVDLSKIKGVVLHTQYDGILYQSSGLILSRGIRNEFGDEVQFVLPISEWKVKDDPATEKIKDN